MDAMNSPIDTLPKGTEPIVPTLASRPRASGPDVGIVGIDGIGGTGPAKPFAVSAIAAAP